MTDHHAILQRRQDRGIAVPWDASGNVHTASPDAIHAERLAAGQACLDAALAFLALGITPLCCCDPAHVGVGKTHAKICKSRDHGKVPMGTWKDLQTMVPSETEVSQWWKTYPIGNLGIVLG